MFNNCNTGFSMPVVPAGYGSSGYGMGGFGGDWWGIIVLLLIFGAFNGNGFGGFGFGGGNGGYSEIQRGFDQNAVINKLDGLTYGLSDSTYALNSALNTGFNGVQQTLCHGFNGVNTAILQSANGTERGFAGLSSQLAQCCCDNRAAIADVKYQMATQACDTRNLVQNTTRDIIDNANANNRAILDFLVNDKLATLQAENQSLRLAASQANQNSVLMAAMDANKAEILRKTGAECPQAAYIVQPPQPVTFPTNCCGQYNGYGYGSAVVGA